MIDLLIYLGIIVVLCIAAWYVLTQLNLPEPVGKMVTIAIVIVVAVVIVGILLSLKGGHLGIAL